MLMTFLYDKFLYLLGDKFSKRLEKGCTVSTLSIRDTCLVLVTTNIRVLRLRS